MDKAAENLPWTLDAAIEQLQTYPRDAYLQYVVMQLGRMENRTEDADAAVFRSNRRQFANPRAQGVDLFSLFSGSLAIQESLQLETMQGGGDGSGPVEEEQSRLTDGRSIVRLRDIAGPTIKSHPWEEMLGNDRPEVSTLARSVPVDFYFIEFGSLIKLVELADSSDLWGIHFFSQSNQQARTQRVGERIREQLAVETNKLSRPFYDAVVDEVAITGSDLFMREGSDVTLLFRFRRAALFKTQMEGYLRTAEKAHADATRTQGEYRGVQYVQLTTPNRSVHVLSAYPEDGLHVRSNSKVAFERVIDAILGSDRQGRTVTRLGETSEFAYIRTLMPRGAAEEDGFVYLSDPFIRRLVGPQLKLTERRRMICYNHLRMIGHAALLHRTQTGQNPTSLDELVNSGFTPGEFGTGNLACPDAGTYKLAPDGLTAACSHHGHAHSLTPCCEIPLNEVSAKEAAEYRQFLDEYNRYWRTFFDPIAIRIRTTPVSYRIETIILPLIDNSIYTALASATSGKPEPLDSLPVPRKNIFSLTTRFNKAELIRSMGLDEIVELPPSDVDEARSVRRDLEKSANSLGQLGVALNNYDNVHGNYPTDVSYDKAGRKTGLSWRVHILPYIGERELHQEFHFDEPWDSQHNKDLIPRLPPLFRPENEKLADAGKTRFVAPVGKSAMMPDTNKAIRFRDIHDGSSNTIMLVEADDEHAVVWTSPDDLRIDAKNPQTGLAEHPPGAFLAIMADGSRHLIRTSIEQATLAALLTRDGREDVFLDVDDEIALPPFRPQHHGSVPYEDELRGLNAGPFVTHGIGNQIGMHVYDNEPAFSFSLPRFLGMSLGNFNGRSGFIGDDGELWISMLIASLNSPVYVSIPVQDASVVDEFLDRLEVMLAELARHQEDGSIPFFRVSQDYYQISLEGNVSARAYGFSIGPVKWRVFWARIGDGLYVASKPFILEDLAAMQTVATTRSADTAAPLPPAHAMVRLRPTNWDQIQSEYKLGWAENNRHACLHNLGPLLSVARANGSTNRVQKSSELPPETVSLGKQIYDAYFFCPEGGHYLLGSDGHSLECSVHGSRASPRQHSAPSSNTESGRWLGSLSDVVLALTFLEDGLHAVVTIERRPSNTATPP